MQRLILEEGLVDRKDRFHIKGAGLEDLLQRNTRLLGFNHRREVIERFQPFLQGRLLFLGDEINLVEQNLVGKGNLLHGLVDTLLVELLVVEMLHHMLAICETNDGIDGVIIEQFGIGPDLNERKDKNGTGMG